MKKILEWLSGGILKQVGEIVDDVVTTKEEKEVLKNKLRGMILDQALESDKLKAAIIETEAKGNFLQRSWRPILMLAFGAIVVFQYFLYPILFAFGDFPDLPLMDSDFWGLLQIGIGGYIVGRSVEKVVPNINFNKKD